MGDVCFVPKNDFAALLKRARKTAAEVVLGEMFVLSSQVTHDQMLTVRPMGRPG
jgi:hypothetical protein